MPGAPRSPACHGRSGSVPEMAGEGKAVGGSSVADLPAIPHLLSTLCRWARALARVPGMRPSVPGHCSAAPVSDQDGAGAGERPSWTESTADPLAPSLSSARSGRPGGQAGTCAQSLSPPRHLPAALSLWKPLPLAHGFHGWSASSLWWSPDPEFWGARGWEHAPPPACQRYGETAGFFGSSSPLCPLALGVSSTGDSQDGTPSG